MIEIFPATTATHFANARVLFQEYAEQLDHDLCFQHFARELANLESVYAPPDGVLLLLKCDVELSGCVATRPHAKQICEMKRLYVRQPYRGRGLGRRLADAIIVSARELGYERMRLDTLRTMSVPIALYRSLGFVETPPYYHNPIPGALFWELDLGARTNKTRSNPSNSNTP